MLVKSAFLRKFEKEVVENGKRMSHGFHRMHLLKEWNFLDSKPWPRSCLHSSLVKVQLCRLSHWIENLEQVIKFLGEQKNKNEARRSGGARLSFLLYLPTSRIFREALMA